MAFEIRVPALGESVSEASVGKWLKKEGEAVKADEPLVELETDKVSIEVPAPASGTLSEISAATGDIVAIGAVLGAIIAGRGVQDNSASAALVKTMPPAPAASKLMAEHGLSSDEVAGSGRRGQILKEDVLRVIKSKIVERPASQASVAKAPLPVPDIEGPDIGGADITGPTGPAAERSDDRREERVPMTRLRQTIARRLKEAQNNAAILTTFNEVDMSAVMELRTQYKDLFLKKHGVKLGFMGFFIKACVGALREIPEVNAEIDGTDLVYKNFYHIGVAVGIKGGLVVPVVRDADRLSLAGIESAIGALAAKARDGKLSMQELSGGTFTISNGGVYGSLMSTPILNAPQSGVLGMHKIEQRPVVVEGEIVVRPMMYLALSYDHRIIDGKQAVTFLVRVKENIEDPRRMILEL